MLSQTQVKKFKNINDELINLHLVEISSIDKLIASYDSCDGKENDENLIDIGFSNIFNPQDMPSITVHESIYIVHDIKTISPKLSGVQKVLNAKDILALNHYEHQRPIIKRRLDELIRKQTDGRHHGGEIAIAVLNGFDTKKPLPIRVEKAGLQNP